MSLRLVFLSVVCSLLLMGPLACGGSSSGYLKVDTPLIPFEPPTEEELIDEDDEEDEEDEAAEDGADAETPAAPAPAAAPPTRSNSPS